VRPEPLPQSADREPPTEAQQFQATVVVACIALFVVGAALFLVCQDFGRVRPELPAVR
jgi:hypothetical protein